MSTDEGDTEVTTTPIPTYPLINCLMNRMFGLYQRKKEGMEAKLPVLGGMPEERPDAGTLRMQALDKAFGFLKSIYEIDSTLLDDTESNESRGTDAQRDNDSQDSNSFSAASSSPSPLSLAQQQLNTFIISLSIPEILLLLGFRLTTGSATDTLPPCLALLLLSFLKPHNTSHSAKDTRIREPDEYLCVGTVALSKHTHRDQTTRFWTREGAYKGSVKQLNQRAVRILVRILNEANWLNIHSLPHGIRVLEVRTGEGYGARWYLHGPDGRDRDSNDGDRTEHVEFRGFLEPHMEGGHERGWIH